MEANTTKGDAKIKKQALAYFKKVAFVGLLLAIVSIAFSLPFLYIHVAGEGEIRSVVAKVTAKWSEPELVAKAIIDWENANMDTIYKRPRFPFLGLNLYVLPDYPYVYTRNLSPTWIAFFKRGACEDKATLFVEMARRAGMQARVVHNPGEDHAWAEVMVDNSWMHVDPSCGYFNDPGVYERENEGGWGKRLSYVYAVDEHGESHDITSRYTGTGRLIIRVEKDGSPVKGAMVFVESRFLVDRGEASTPMLATASETGDNGICAFDLGGNNYRIVAEAGSYRAVEENISLAEEGEKYVTLSLAPVATLPDALLWLVLAILLLVIAGIIWKSRRPIGHFLRCLFGLEINLFTAAGVFAIVAGMTCAFMLAMGVVGLISPIDLDSKIVMLSWTIFGFMGGMFGLLGGVSALGRGQFRQTVPLAILTAAMGVIFWVLYGGFGFILGAPIATLSTISAILIVVSAITSDRKNHEK